MQLYKELALAQSLIKEAGQMAISLQSSLIVKNKDNDEGPVTNADLTIDNFLCSNLKKHFPYDVIISEESFSTHNTIPKNQRTWFIDPIDGTESYLRGEKNYVIMIGLSIDEKPSLGVIFHPASNTLWQGIFVDNKKILAQKIIDKKIENLKVDKAKKSKIRILNSQYHPDKREDILNAKLNPHEIIKISSLGLKAMMIVEDKADIYVGWSKNIKPWDMCAPIAILLSAGGFVYQMDKRPFIISNFDLAKDLVDLINDINRHPMYFSNGS